MKTQSDAPLLDELIQYSNEKSGEITIVLLGGRGAQAAISDHQPADRDR